MDYKYEKQSPFRRIHDHSVPIALSWPIDEFCQRMDSETMNRPVPSHKFRTHTLARDHIPAVLYKLAYHSFSILVALDVWLALAFYSLASSTLALDNLAFSNCGSYHHRSYAVCIGLDARS